MRPNVRSGRHPCILAIALLACVPGGFLIADKRGEAAAVVIYVDGESFTVVDSSSAAVEVDPSDALGFELAAGDTVVTESNTFVELQLVPSANVIKVAENTNFTVESRGSPRGGTFNLVYGKVRARVRTLTEQERFTIRSDSAVAGVRGTDFGVSVELPRVEAAIVGTEAPAAAEPGEEENAALTQVFCFEGEVEVRPTVPAVEEAPGGAAAEGAETVPVTVVVVRANEMVSISHEAEPQEITTEALPEEVRSYWQENDFKAEPVPQPEAETPPEAGGERRPTEIAEAKPAPEQPRVAEPLAEEPRPAPAEEPRAQSTLKPQETFEQTVKRTTASRFQFRAVSVLLFVVGAAMEAAGVADAVLPSANIFGDNGIGLMGAGAVFIAGGVFSTFQAKRYDRALIELQSRGGAP